MIGFFSRLPRINTYEIAPNNAMPPAATKESVKEPVALTMLPVTIGASSPPMLPQKFCRELH